MKCLQSLAPMVLKLGIQTIWVTYSGSGDSGQLDEVQACAEKCSVEDDLGMIESEDLSSKLEYSLITEEQKNQINEVLSYVDSDDLAESIGYMLLEFTPDGYEINEGGQGEVLWNVSENNIEVEHGSNYIEVNHTTYNYDMEGKEVE
jgi:hypothetical protein